MARGGAKRNQRKPKPYDFAAFRGYRGPRFTAIPDEFLDHQLAGLSPAETKVMLFLFRKTYGYRKSADQVSLAQLERGTVSSDGRIIDRGSGLSRATIWRALKGLQEKGLIEVYRQTTAAGDADVNYYRIRESTGPDEPPSPPPAVPSAGPNRPAPRHGGESPSEPPISSGQGWSRNETTPSSELNHPGSATEPRGGFAAKHTRTDSTREHYTPSQELSDLAQRFLQSIGYAKPAAAKRERTLSTLQTLANTDGYTLDELATACEIAASMGARGPELIPHVVGKAPVRSLHEEMGEKVSRREEQERQRWESLTEEFDGLDEAERRELIRQARESNPMLMKRPPDHPLVRGAAIALLDEI